MVFHLSSLFSCCIIHEDVCWQGERNSFLKNLCTKSDGEALLGSFYFWCKSIVVMHKSLELHG